MRVKLDGGQTTVTVRGRIEDGPVFPQSSRLPWPVQVVEFEAVLLCMDGWPLKTFTCVCQVDDPQGRDAQQPELFRYQQTFVPAECPDWAHRLIEGVIQRSQLSVVLPPELYVP